MNIKVKKVSTMFYRIIRDIMHGYKYYLLPLKFTWYNTQVVKSGLDEKPIIY